jgi:NADPH:quinone reductase-like Zn-dependent oxidoreductase
MSIPQQMRALVFEPPHGIRMAEVPVPRPGPGQALIAVEYSALNWVEVARMDVVHRPGDILGRDSAGIVVCAAKDGSGPGVGERVAGFRPASAWAEFQAVDTADIAVVPAEVDLASAAALPGAAVSALQAVRRLGSILGRRVLVTGASGGVGRAAVQLAALAGAEVVAAVGAAGRGLGLTEIGASEVVTTLDNLSPVYAVLDVVGGDTLTAAYELLETDGVALSIGSAAGQVVSFDFEAARLRGGRQPISAFAVCAPFGPDLAYLLSLVAAGRFDPQIGWHGSWHDADTAITALLNREVRGKAVLHLD